MSEWQKTWRIGFNKLWGGNDRVWYFAQNCIFWSGPDRQSRENLLELKKWFLEMVAFLKWHLHIRLRRSLEWSFTKSLTHLVYLSQVLLVFCHALMGDWCNEDTSQFQVSWLRYSPLVSVSKVLARWLRSYCGIPQSKSPKFDCFFCVLERFPYDIWFSKSKAMMFALYDKNIPSGPNNG